MHASLPGPGIHRYERAEAARLSTFPGVARCEDDAAVDRILESGPASVRADGEEVAELRALAARALRARQIAERTLRRAVVDTGDRLSGGTELAVHPDAVRARATAVTEARNTLVEAERALAEHDVVSPSPSLPSGAVGSGPAGEASPSAGNDGDPAPGRRRRNQAVGLLIAAVGLALVLVGTGAVSLWVALIIPLVAAIVALRLLPGGSEVAAAPPASSGSMLAEVDSFTGDAARRRTTEAGYDVTRSQLEIARTLAEEELRVAERSWRDLAGEDASVDDVEDVVRRFDPQHETAAAVAAESVSVRATATVASRLEEEWRTRWEALGLAAPALEHSAVQVALSALEDGGGAGPAVVVLSGPAAERAEELASRWPDVAVVVEAGAAS